MDAFIRCARTLAGALALITLLPSPSLPEHAPALCGKAREQATMARCADAHLKKANAELATTLQQLLAATEKSNHKLVSDAHSAWESFRDNECLSRIGEANRDSAVRPTLQLQCQVRLTHARIMDLKEQAKCPAGRTVC